MNGNHRDCCASSDADSNGLSRRRIAVQKSAKRPLPLWQARSPPDPRHSQKNYRILKWIAIVTAVSVMLGMYIIVVNNRQQAITCNSNNSGALPSQSKYILMASHLRQGADGELRLRIIAHNLRLLFSEKGDNDSKNTKPLKSIIIFSLDDGSSQESADAVHAMVEQWRQSPALHGLISDILFVKNDAVLVDASKWMAALYKLLPTIHLTNARVMLLNDSFLLTRNVPELWKDSCGGVCGLVWTAAADDPTRHIQSYIRSLSSCEVDSYIRFYEERKGSVRNVNELIQLFEINLGWAGGAGSVSAIYDYAGAHPDNDEAQKILIPHGYPAIKLKKFFITDDPWLSEDETSRSRLPPSFSVDIYKRMNHDLNHLSHDDLENHFTTSGKNEGRIYSSSRPLVIKDWMKEELMTLGEVGGGESTIGILEDYLAALDAGIAAN